LIGKMKPRLKAIVGVLVSLALLTSFSQLSLVKSETSSIENQALAYITNVLPINITGYITTLQNSDNDSAVFSLNKDSTILSARIIFQNNNVQQVLIEAQSGKLVYNLPNSSMVDFARTFLQGHQAFTGFDSTEMISALDTVNASLFDFNLASPPIEIIGTSGNITLSANQVG
jgi:hypothetical protein